jgi:FMN phosphatase YigB (HAD superfamily)
MKKNNFNPSTHIFLWDLHEVILEKNMRSWFTICLTFNRKWELIRKLNRKSLAIVCTFVLERLKIIKKQMVSEELVQAAQTTGNDELIELITQVCSAYSPIKETISIIQELSILGYKHHLGSNIGKTVFDNCMVKFPTIFKFFEGHSIPFNTLESKMVKKPHPDFFTTHLQKYNLKPEHLIFIDDKLINVQAAQSVGMHGIHFKNPKQLRNQLQKIGIFN